jgi:anti-sigma factor RsiW
MNDHWHRQIQRHMNGESGPEESAALEAALARDPEVRALYLDYMNLDAALGATAEAAAAAAGPADGRPGHARRSWPRWQWLAPVAACAALVAVAVLSEHRAAVPPPPDLAAATSSARSAIAHLRPQVPSPLPAWMSPTASLLPEPGGAR